MASALHSQSIPTRAGPIGLAFTAKAPADRLRYTLECQAFLEDADLALISAEVSGSAGLTLSEPGYRLAGNSKVAVNVKIAGGTPGMAGMVRFLLELTGNERLEVLVALPVRDDAPSGLLLASGSPGGSVTITPYSQAKHEPTAAPITRNVQPFGVTLASPNSNLGYWKFSSTDSAATVPNRTVLDSQMWYTNLFGDSNAPNTAPQNGIPNNWVAVYANYPATLSDGITADPRDLMPIKPDGIHLKARKRLPSSSDNFLFEMAQLRLPTEFRPGDYIEMRAKLPSTKRSAGSYWSWPTFWGFSGWQDPVRKTKYVAAQGGGLEFDVLDNYQTQEYRQGTNNVHGVLLYGPESQYNNPATLYITSGPDFLPAEVPSSLARLYPAPEVDPTEDFHVYAMDWAADNSKVTFLIDGKITWVRSVFSPAINTAVPDSEGRVNFEGGQFEAARQGTPMGMFIQIAHQFGVRFNGGDITKLDAAAAAGDVVADDYVVDYIGHWRSNSTAVPFVPTPATTVTLDGATYTWTNKGAAVAYGGGGQPVTLQAPPATEDDFHILTRPMGSSTGTWTAKIALMYPGVNFYFGGLLTRNSSTGARSLLFGLYPGRVSTYAFLATFSDGAGNGYAVRSAQADQTWINVNEYAYVRIVLDGTNVTYLGSRTGLANSWVTVGSMTTAVAGSPDQVGFYMNSKDASSAGVKGQVRVASLRYAAGTDPQAAAP